jgi:SAM-dependent methyltransferase
MTKRYDRQYFDRWYRNPSTKVISRDELRRKVAVAVSVAEFFLHREIESVLDVGCGEAPWFVELRRLRPKVDYIGLDPSDYVVKRFGARRHVRKASFADLASLDLEPGFDLIVCSDVMHYVPDAELKRGIRTMAGLAGGLAFLEVLTSDDDIIGDLDGLIRRPASWYRQQLTDAGFAFAGPHCWLSAELQSDTSMLEVTV